MSTKTNSFSPPQLQAGQHQQVNLTQRLIMSAHMQQAIRLLQLPLQELEPFIEEQVVLNPLLEIADKNEELEDHPAEDENEREDHDQELENEVSINDRDLNILTRLDEDWREHFSGSEPAPIKRSAEEDKLKSYLEQSIFLEPSLHEQLLQQARQSFNTPRELEIAQILIGYIDQYGFLKTPLAEICALHQFSEIEVKSVLKEIQTFDPCGVGASSTQESLLIQLRSMHKDKSLAYRIIEGHYEELIHNHIPQIQKKLKCSCEAIQKAIEKDISTLDLHPGTHFSSAPSQTIIPDVILREEEGKLIVEVERDYTPSLRLNHRYLKMLEDPTITTETKHFIKHHLFSARWLVRNLQQRYSTLERIAQVLADKQYHFFISPEGKLVPMIMKTVAEELNLHESTIARTVSNKYIFSPRGLFPLRTFFTNKYVSEEGIDLSSKTVKDEILELINGEDKTCPLSDDKISAMLKDKGIKCARRTVAKYRITLCIGNAQQRRKFG